MKKKNWICVVLIFIFIIAFGLVRVRNINHNELIAGTPTMTGSITFIAYGIIAIIISFASLLILKINSIKESVFNKTVKVIFNAFILIISLLTVFIILFFYH